jgi:hypothetical protein
MRKAKGTTTIKSAILCVSFLALSSCAGGRTAGEHIADMPYWMGGLPADAPPRRGTPEYDEMMAKRAREAARPKTEQQQYPEPSTHGTFRTQRDVAIESALRSKADLARAT